MNLTRQRKRLLAIVLAAGKAPLAWGQRRRSPRLLRGRLSALVLRPRVGDSFLPLHVPQTKPVRRFSYGNKCIIRTLPWHIETLPSQNTAPYRSYGAHTPHDVPNIHVDRYLRSQSGPDTHAAEAIAFK